MDSQFTKVLLIEDNPDDARLLREALVETSRSRFELVHLERLSEGLRYLAEKNVDVVLLDLSLPDGYRLDTLAQMQAVAPHIPIVVLTSLNDETLAVKAVEEGAQDYLVKGIQMDSNLLVRAIHYAIERKRMEKALRESEDRFRSLVESVKDYAIFMLDPGGHVISWNAGAERIKGYLAEEIIGQHFSCFYLSEDIERGKPERTLKLAVTEGWYEDEGWRVRKDGSRF